MPYGLLAALDISGKVNQFGAYAGLAAIVGLGVLSVLYFAQAREVKRLRDWAGRAPERAAELEAAAEQAAQSRMAPHPQANAPAAPARPSPAAAATAAAAAGVRPGVAPAATPLTRTGAPATTAPVPGQPAPLTPATPAAPGTPAPAAGTAAAAAAAAAAKASADTGQPTVIIPPVAPGTPAPAVAVQPPTQAPATPAPRPAPAAPLRAPAPAAYTPSSARAQSGAERELGVEGRSPLRSTLAIVAGVIAVAVLVFVLITQVFGGDSSTPPNRVAGEPGATTAKTTATTRPKTTKPTSTVSRANVTVAFLNGTRVTGVARGASNKVQAGGYKIGAITNAVDQTAQTTTVYFADGQRAQAVQVASLLSLPASAVQPIDQSTRVVAGPDADVVVVVGADQSGA